MHTFFELPRLNELGKNIAPFLSFRSSYQKNMPPKIPPKAPLSPGEEIRRNECRRRGVATNAEQRVEDRAYLGMIDSLIVPPLPSLPPLPALFQGILKKKEKISFFFFSLQAILNSGIHVLIHPIPMISIKVWIVDLHKD